MQDDDLTPIPLAFGSTARLFGVLLHPRDTKRTGLVMLNAGLLNSAGPFRLHVDLSERLAKKGFTVLRMDQCGKGESDARVGVARETALSRDIDDALELLKKCDVDRAVLLGLCSGADDALFVAADREDVAGLILLDGYAARTPRFHWHRFWYYVGRMMTADGWSRLREVFGSYWPARSEHADETRGPVDMRDWGSTEEMIEMTRSTLGHAEILAIFTGSVKRYYNHANQLTGVVRNGQAEQHLTEVFYPDADHLYGVPPHRSALVDQIEGWMQRHYSGVEST
jgi:pimeloyl-ACP methyl ester carboxylesterase